MVVPELLPERFRKGPVFVPRSTATSKANILNPEKEEKDRGEGHPEDEETFDDTQAAMSLSRIKEQAPFEEKVPS